MTCVRRQDTYHLCQTSSRDNVPSVHQTVQMPRRFFNLFPHIIVAVKVEDVGYKVQRILVVLDLGIQTREVEAVGKVFLVNFAKVLVSS